MSVQRALERVRAGNGGRPSALLRAVAASLLLASLLVGVVGSPTAGAAEEPPRGAAPGGSSRVIWLTQDDFRFGTYIIDEPGIYRLAEDISFNPNSPATLTEAIASGELDPGVAAGLGLPVPPEPVDAYHAGFPLPTQFAEGGVDHFTPGGPMDARYDPAAYGIGFFAAIAIAADNVVVDLNGHTLEQAAEHALLMRFFALIELADQPFLPGQGPSDFGSELTPANRVTIKNGTLGRSAHHGIHGNLNTRITINDVAFDGYEVAAVSLNGVEDLRIQRATATNRKDVPVVGTFSSGQFIKAYVEELVRNGSTTELTVDGTSYDATEIRDALRTSINAVHHDIIVAPNHVDGRAQIDESAHPDEYALFTNPHGLVDGNSYSFLVNARGVAVDGFPSRPDGIETTSALRVWMRDVEVRDQWAFINEIPAINRDGAAVIDPVGAVFQVMNTNPDTGEPVTVSSLDPATARYTGNVIANAQALVAKATLNGEFDDSSLDVSRLSINSEVLNWIEGTAGSETLAELNPDPATSFLCNGDSMFHVNKGVIAFKIDGVSGARISRTSVSGLRNLGLQGSTVCGDYSGTVSHPNATLYGYGGAVTRAYTFAGSDNIQLSASTISDIGAAEGYAIGVDVLTDSRNVTIRNVQASGVYGGMATGASYVPPNLEPRAVGFYVGADARRVMINRSCATGLDAPAGGEAVHDLSGVALTQRIC